MKKSLLALAVLGAYAGVASAQSSVQLFGTLDVGAKWIKNDGRERAVSQSTDGINSSEVRFQGIEDLGGGLKAGFNLRTGVNPDSGTANAKFWNRRATVSLYSNFGELRLGRDYVPTFWTQALFDPFGYNGIGNVGNVARYGQVRADNSFGYFLPSNLGGWYGQLMYSAAENGTNADRPGRYFGGQFGFRAGPFDVAAAYAETELVNATIPGSVVTGLPTIPNQTKIKTANIGGSWDFGFAKIMGFYDQEKLEVAKEQRWEIGASFPFGQSEVRVGYMEDKMDPNGAAADSKVTNLAATYQYNLSKRTALYGTGAYLKNKNLTSVSLPGAFQAPTAGGKSKGLEFGVRHFF